MILIVPVLRGSSRARLQSFCSLSAIVPFSRGARMGRHGSRRNSRTKALRSRLSKTVYLRGLGLECSPTKRCSLRLTLAVSASRNRRPASLKLVMIVDEARDGLRGPADGHRTLGRRIRRLGLGAQFRYRQPIVFVRAFCNPWRKRHTEIFAQRLRISLVEHPHVAQPLVRVAVQANVHPAFAQQRVKLLIPLQRQPVGRIV